MRNEVAQGPERDRFMQIGDEIYRLIPAEEKLENVGRRIAIDLKTREYRFYDGGISSEQLAVTNPTWTCVVRAEQETVRVYNQ